MGCSLQQLQMSHCCLLEKKCILRKSFICLSKDMGIPEGSPPDFLAATLNVISTYLLSSYQWGYSQRKDIIKTKPERCSCKFFKHIFR